MSALTVTTQAELNEAIEYAKAHPDDWTEIDIRSERGVWLELRETPGSATVRASGSATVRASGSATVRASGSATVRASGSATVSASDSATVRAWDSATVSASDSATVSASGSATVRASGSATVSAGTKVAVHLHSARANITGGIVIDVTDGPPTSAAEWCDWYGVAVEDGIATLYKAVNDQYTTDRGFDYSPGATPEAPDWRSDDTCGGGLHFSPDPHMALDYFDDAIRFVAVGVAVADLRVIPGGTAKAKAPRVVRACVEVDIAAREIQAVTA